MTSSLDEMILHFQLLQSTSDSLNALAHSAVAVGGSIGEAKKVATELAASGKYTGEQIGLITEATVAWEHATGKSVQATIKEFESLAVQSTGSTMRATEAISRATVKLDDTYHFLTESVYEQIRAMEKEGDAKGASALATETFAKATEDRAHEIVANLGFVARAWNSVKETIGGATDAVNDWGKKATAASKVADLEAQLAAKNPRTYAYVVQDDPHTGRGGIQLGMDRTNMLAALAKARADLSAVEKAADEQSKKTIEQSKGVHAAAMLAAQDAREQKKDEDSLAEARARNKQLESSTRAANPGSDLVTPEAIAARDAATVKAHTAAAQRGEDASKALLDGLLKSSQAEVAATKAKYDQLDKLADLHLRAGEISDHAAYEIKRADVDAVAKAQLDGYNRDLDNLNSYHGKTNQARQQNLNTIEQTEAAKKLAAQGYADKLALLDEAERVRQAAVSSVSDEATNKYLSGLQAEAAKMREANSVKETSRGAVERLAAARLDDAAAITAQTIAAAVANGESEKTIEGYQQTLIALQNEAAVRRDIAAAADQQQSTNFAKKAADQAIADWQRVGQSISSSLSNAFGSGGKAIGDMFKAYATGIAGQLRAQKDLAAAKKLSDDNPEKIDAINRAQLSGAQAQVQSYADMTGAAQGFFAEGSKGYQAMGAASQVLHASEVALSLIKGVNAVLTQGEGDPYSAFGRMAAMAAIVAGLGVTIAGGSGSGGGQSAADVQKAQGTGSVFGDSSAKSDSIRRSIEQLQKNSSDMLPINQGMLTALQAIESAMTGLTNLVVRTTGLTDGTNMGIQEGTIGKSTGASIVSGAAAGAIAGSYFGPIGTAIGAIGGAIIGGLKSIWGKTSQTIVDSGLQYGGSLRGLQSGAGFNQYASVDTTTSSWFGLSKSTNNSVQTQGLTAELSAQFGLIFTSLDKSLQAASVAMGGSAADVTKVLDGLNVGKRQSVAQGPDRHRADRCVEQRYFQIDGRDRQCGLPGI